MLVLNVSWYRESYYFMTDIKAIEIEKETSVSPKLTR